MMETKVCSKCKRKLPLSQFHRDNRRGATHYSQCRDCKAEYKKANKEKLLIAQYKRRENPTTEDKLKISAWNKLNYALKTGKIKKPSTCEICGEEAVLQSHHADYNKPCDVTWCCQKCHSALDKSRRSA